MLEFRTIYSLTPRSQEKVAELNKELTLQLYGEPLKDDDGEIMPWSFQNDRKN
jgi:hypothetical protein